MRDRTDDYKNNKYKKIAKVIIGFISILVIMFFTFGIALSGKIKIDKVSSINKKAQNQYMIFAENEDYIFEKLNIPENGIFYITGECHDYEYYLAYAGNLFTRDKVVYGNAKDEINGYWAIKIENGIITETWFSNYLLKESQLISYSIKEQKRQMHLFDTLAETETVGYYSSNETENER